jgi:hypothetical protein
MGLSAKKCRFMHNHRKLLSPQNYRSDDDVVHIPDIDDDGTCS